MASVFVAVACLSSAISAAGTGKWGSTIKFPLVPVAAAVVPQTGKLLTWSAYKADDFSGGSGFTQTAEYDPATGRVSQATVSNTKHDMFCPGISFDFNGRLIVTGGNDAAKTSIYSSGSWSPGGDMKIPRGYQSSTTLSDGRVFTIGGSWSGARGGKNGEVFNVGSNSWSLLSGCLVAPMLTNDAQGIFRSDNHAWLFGWKNGNVFQGGPSRAMNWYGTSGSGSTTRAGNRGSDTDAMTGVAVMYDAPAGKIFSAGGSPSYQDSSATRNAQVITIGTPGTTASVQDINKLWYARAFANAVVLPDGTVFITGGQSYAVPFSDANSSMIPEMWDPVTTRFTKMATIPTPRNYHSVAVLMPDATVFNGGGGLCGSCTTNHFDGQMYSPPYLFQADGTTPASRPVISGVSTTTVKVGGSLVATVSASSTVSFSLIRMGSSTHSVNTDQRRIPLTPSSSGSSHTLTVPSDPGVALPGYWYLFAMVNGVPSVARIIKVTL